MKEFGKCLPEPGRVRPVDTSCTKPVQKDRSLALANAARMSIDTEWNRKLDNLRKPPDKKTCRLGPQG
jgi:hypothetical protein